MNNIIEDKKSKNNESNNGNLKNKQIDKSGNNGNNQNVNIKGWILLITTLLVPVLLTYTQWKFFDFNDYMFWLGITVYIESFFIYFIKKLAPRINLAYIWAFLLVVILFFYQSVDGRGQLVIIFLLIFIPLLGAISYFGGHLITAIILAIQRAIKKEKVYDEEMKKICEGLGIGLLIIIWLLIHFYN